MIALKLLPIVQLIVLFTDLTNCYPSNFYNSRRLSRAAQHHPTYDPYEYYYYTRSQRYPYSYYPTYTQMYPEEYYYNQDAYPLYYVSPRASKYDYYQSALPYYYQDVPLARDKYNNYYNYQDMSPEDQERLLQEVEREEREKSQPIGHEIRYENDEDQGDASIDETNAAFLNNLMMQQMYQDSLKGGSSRTYPSYDQYQEYPNSELLATKEMPRWDEEAYDRPVNLEDEEVEELKALPKKPKNRKNKQRKQRKQPQEKIRFFDHQASLKRSSEDVTVFSDRKPIVKASDFSADGPRRDVRGQKEEVLMRPATPVRHPFSDSVMQMMQHQQEEKKRSPSVYDTIKHMLDMEKKYEEEQKETKPDLRPTMKKRIVSSEDSLTKQLSVLKKAQQ